MEQQKQSENFESQARKRLRSLEKEGKYVFHGSGSLIKTLEPRQAHNYPTNSGKDRILDDRPAVFASPSADIAIFMAIVNIKNAPKGCRSGFGANDDGVEFRVTKQTIDQIESAKGYVYVLDKDKFIERSPEESLSYDSVLPIETIEVSKSDLLIGIVIKDF